MRLMTATDSPEFLWLAFRIRPRGTARQAERVRLLIEAAIPRCNQGFTELLNLGRLARFGIRNGHRRPGPAR